MVGRLITRYKLRDEVRRLKRLGAAKSLDFDLREKLEMAEQKLFRFEYEELLAKARKWGVDIPTHQEKPGWYDSNSTPGMNLGPLTRYWLSENGRSVVLRLIKEERQKEIEWWFKLMMPLITSLIGILGLIVALVSLLIKSK
jgi:hypothetical protein